MSVITLINNKKKKKKFFIQHKSAQKKNQSGVNNGIKIEAILYAKHVHKNVKEWTKIAKKKNKNNFLPRLKENTKKKIRILICKYSPIMINNDHQYLVIMQVFV